MRAILDRAAFGLERCHHAAQVGAGKRAQAVNAKDVELLPMLNVRRPVAEALVQPLDPKVGRLDHVTVGGNKPGARFVHGENPA